MTDSKVWRPVQFLGSKLRVLDQVRAACTSGLDQSARVWDAFAGSSVVSQSFANDSRPVLATDALASSVVFARALLGIDRRAGNPLDLIPLVLDRANQVPVGSEWNSALAAERVAIESRDAGALAILSRSLPQRWRREGATQAQLHLFDAVDVAAHERTSAGPGLLSATYAGTYFGASQAVRMEQIRSAVTDLADEGSLDGWQTAAVLTALSSAASRAVYSAGKHFAQPLRISGSGFHSRRLLSDRAIDIDLAFSAGMTELNRAARPAGEHHEAEVAEAQTIEGARLAAMNIRSVYADPPYTAQQYSRFYHLLDVLVAGVPAELQVRSAQVTSGLYPAARYASPFCSRTRAPAAFSALARNARDADARLVVSYSVSARGSIGNARSIGLESLLEAIRAEYGRKNVALTELELQYRQFNSSSRSSPTRNDVEVLIVGEPN